MIANQLTNKQIQFILLSDSEYSVNPKHYYKIKKFHVAFSYCRGTFGGGQGLKPKMVVRLYKALLVPRVTYASAVCWPKTEQVSVFQQLKRLRSLVSREEWLQHRDSLSGHDDVWFTDVSRSKDGSGAGYYCRRDVNEKFLFLGRYATVFQIDVMAILGCAQRLRNFKTVSRDISICSDSQVALRALAVPATHQRLVGECKEALGSLAESNRLRLLWVPGHTSIRGYEIANMLASLGARSGIVGPEPFVGISRC